MDKATKLFLGVAGGITFVGLCIAIIIDPTLADSPSPGARPQAAAPATSSAAPAPSASPKPVPASVSPTATSGPAAADTAKAVDYLNQVDNGKHSRADDQAVIDDLSHKCNDDMLVLAFAATNTGLDVAGATGADQDVYAVLHQLDTDLSSAGSPTECEPRLATVQAELVKAHGGNSSFGTSGSSSASSGSGGGGGCHPLTNGGKCYSPGEYCRTSDHGISGIDGNGDPIVCRDNHGWRWEPA